MLAIVSVVPLWPFGPSSDVVEWFFGCLVLLGSGSYFFGCWGGVGSNFLGGVCGGGGGAG